MKRTVQSLYASAVDAERRRTQIATMASADGEVTVDDLAERFGVSTMTVRRDLDALETLGVVRRTRGGAIPLASRGFEPPFVARQEDNRPAKEAIAAAAAELIGEGETIVLDVGTTTLQLARLLRRRRNLTVITASLPIANELANAPGLRVLLTGGELRPGELSLVGPGATATFSALNADTMFLGVAGVHPLRGLTEYRQEDAEVKRAALGASRRCVVLADESKLGRVAFAHVAPLTAVSTLITDAPADNFVCAHVQAVISVSVPKENP